MHHVIKINLCTEFRSDCFVTNDIVLLCFLLFILICKWCTNFKLSEKECDIHCLNENCTFVIILKTLKISTPMANIFFSGKIENDPKHDKLLHVFHWKPDYKEIEGRYNAIIGIPYKRIRYKKNCILYKMSNLLTVQ